GIQCHLQSAPPPGTATGSTPHCGATPPPAHLTGITLLNVDHNRGRINGARPTQKLSRPTSGSDRTFAWVLTAARSRRTVRLRFTDMNVIHGCGPRVWCARATPHPGRAAHPPIPTRSRAGDRGKEA